MFIELFRHAVSKTLERKINKCLFLIPQKSGNIRLPTDHSCILFRYNWLLQGVVKVSGLARKQASSLALANVVFKLVTFTDLLK